MAHVLRILAFSLLLATAGCGAAAPTTPPAGGGVTNPTGTAAGIAPTAPAAAPSGPPVASTATADLLVNVYKVQPYTVPATAPSGFQPGPGKQAVVLELEIKNQ